MNVSVRESAGTPAPSRYQDYRLSAATLSAPMLAVVRRMLAGETVAPAESRLSKREWVELMTVLGRAP